MDKSEAEAIAAAMTEVLGKLVPGAESEEKSEDNGDGEDVLDLNDHAAVKAELDRLAEENEDLRFLQGRTIPEGKTLDDALGSIYTTRSGNRAIDPDFGMTDTPGDDKSTDDDKVIGGTEQDHRSGMKVSVGNRAPVQSRRREASTPTKLDISKMSIDEIGANREALEKQFAQEG